MIKKIQILAVALSICGATNAQQSNVNLCHNPQKDTEGLIPFSASLKFAATDTPLFIAYG